MVFGLSMGWKVLQFWSVLLMGVAALPGCMTYSGAQIEQEGLERFEYQALGMRISALRGGDSEGPRAVYVHGSPGSARSWAEFLTEAPYGIEAVALDRPGFGASESKRALSSLADQAAAIEPLLVKREGRWHMLIGHSLGGPIILQTAAMYPERVAGIVILSGSVDPWLERLRWYNYLAKRLAWVLPGTLRRSNDEMWSLRPELQKLSGVLGQVRCPVWIVHGTDDGLVPVENVEFLEQVFPDARTILLEGAGHLILWRKPWKEQVKDVLEEAAKEALDAGGSPSVQF